MSLSDFEHIKDYLHAAMNMAAQGMVEVEGRSVLSDHNDQNYHQKIDKDQDNLDVHISCESMTDYPIIPSKILLKTKAPHLYRLSFPNYNHTPIRIEGTFNEWGKDKTQEWVMDFTNDGENFMNLDISDFKDGFSYRFFADNKLFLDPSVNSFSVEPGEGFCCRAENHTRHLLNIPLTLNSECLNKNQLSENSAFQFRKHPDWLIPQSDKIHLKTHSHLYINFILHISNEIRGQKIEDVLILENQDNSEMIFELPVELHFEEPYIYAEIESDTFSVDRPVIRGEIQVFQIPIITKGSGEIELIFFGHGVSHRQTINSETNARKEHQISLEVDTASISPGQAKSLKVHVITNSIIANKRRLSFFLKIGIVKLTTYPVSRLDWSQAFKGERAAQFIEFYRADTQEPVDSVLVDIPDELEGILFTEHIPNTSHAINFILDTDSINTFDKLSGKITVQAKIHGGLAFEQDLEYKLEIIAIDGDIWIEHDQYVSKTERYTVRVKIKNPNNSPLKIFDIRWRKNGFTRLTRFSESDLKYPVVGPNETIELMFTPNARFPMLWPKTVSDVIKIRYNGINSVIYEKKIEITLLPVLRNLSKPDRYAKKNRF